MGIESILIFLLIGAIAGWLAGLIVSGFGFGLIGNIVVGIVGAFLGGLIFSLLGGHGVTGFNFYSFIVAVIGAVVLLAIINFVQRR